MKTKTTKIDQAAAEAMAHSLESIQAASVRLYRIAGFWCFRIVDERGRVRLGTARTREGAIVAGFANPAETMEQQRRAS